MRGYPRPHQRSQNQCARRAIVMELGASTEQPNRRCGLCRPVTVKRSNKVTREPRLDRSVAFRISAGQATDARRPLTQCLGEVLFPNDT